MSKKIKNIFGSMRMMLPEHKEEILERTSEEALVEKPVIEEDAFDEMHFRILDSIQYDYAITVHWFKNVRGGLGQIETAWGVVTEIDAVNMRFKLINYEDVWWIQVKDVVGVKKDRWISGRITQYWSTGVVACTFEGGQTHNL
jgi:hypothetical protein